MLLAWATAGLIAVFILWVEVGRQHNQLGAGLGCHLQNRVEGPSVRFEPEYVRERKSLDASIRRAA